MKFKAFATADVTGEVKDAEHFQYGELKWKEGRLSADITEEHGKPSDAVVVIFQGWMDRVLTLGFAYTSEAVQPGHLQGKESHAVFYHWIP